MPWKKSLYLGLAVAELSSLGNFFQNSLEDSGALWRALEFIRPQAPDNFKEAEENSVRIPEIEFQDVHFSYTRDKEVIKGVSLKFAGGKWTGISGSSGCGKTTLVSIILRLFLQSRGEVRLGGVDIKNFDRAYLSKNISIVLQESLLWNDTFAQNISFGRENAPKEAITRAARLACIDDFISGLSLGYDTIIGEAGAILSEGQKQRIAIARALIREPKILILDEATSSIDIETEAKIFNNIRENFPETTVILISHRPQSLEFADYFFRMEGGRIIDNSGSSSIIAPEESYGRREGLD